MTAEPVVCRRLQADDKVDIATFLRVSYSCVLPRGSGDRVLRPCCGSVEPEEAPRRLKAGMGGYSLPIVLVARLGVDEGQQGRGIGSALLIDA